MPCGVHNFAIVANAPPKTHIAPLNIDTSKKPWYALINAPLIGGPIRLPRPAIAKPIPMYVPTSRGLLRQTVKAAATPEMIVPEVKPNTTAKTIKLAFVLALLMQNAVIPVEKPPSANALMRPYLSARIPGIIRPKVDDALRMANK